MSYQFVKRFFDIFFSIIAIIIFSPIFSIISILILIFDNGPIIFKQRRVGHKKFIIYKFRSLPISTKNIPSISLEKIKITKIGKLLRRTNADELPQLINILKGGFVKKTSFFFGNEQKFRNIWFKKHNRGS